MEKYQSILKQIEEYEKQLDEAKRAVDFARVGDPIHDTQMHGIKLLAKMILRYIPGFSLPYNIVSGIGTAVKVCKRMEAEGKYAHDKYVIGDALRNLQKYKNNVARYISDAQSMAQSMLLSDAEKVERLLDQLSRKERELKDLEQRMTSFSGYARHMFGLQNVKSQFDRTNQDFKDIRREIESIDRQMRFKPMKP